MKRLIWSALALQMMWLGGSCSTAIPAMRMAAATSESARPFGFSAFGSTTFVDSDDDGLPDARLGFLSPDIHSIPTASKPDLYYDDGGNGGLLAVDEDFFTATLEEAADRKAPASPETERKMIYTASFGVMVPTVDDAIQRLTARVKELGGYLSKRQDSTLTVRIPADKFQTLIEEIPEFGRITSRSLNASDVTNQHTDLTIRLENAEKSRKRLLALLDKATKMEDVIKIETALRRITTEIEQMKGQLKLLNNQIAFSTVTVGFQANAPAGKAKKRRQNSRFPWINRLGVSQDLRRF